VKRDVRWIMLALLAYIVAGQILYFVFGIFILYLIWNALGLLFGYILGVVLKRRFKSSRVEEWRKSHPGMSDDRLPDYLK
jgi:predicted permease